jgi:hypothetical protein
MCCGGMFALSLCGLSDVSRMWEQVGHAQELMCPVCARPGCTTSTEDCVASRYLRIVLVL